MVTRSQLMISSFNEMCQSFCHSTFFIIDCILLKGLWATKIFSSNCLLHIFHMRGYIEIENTYFAINDISQTQFQKIPWIIFRTWLACCGTPGTHAVPRAGSPPHAHCAGIPKSRILARQSSLLSRPLDTRRDLYYLVTLNGLGLICSPKAWNDTQKCPRQDPCCFLDVFSCDATIVCEKTRYAKSSNILSLT